MELVGTYNKHNNRRPSTIEEEISKMYDRLVVTCQIKSAEASVRQPTEIAPVENYIELKLNHE